MRSIVCWDAISMPVVSIARHLGQQKINSPMTVAFLVIKAGGHLVCRVDFARLASAYQCQGDGRGSHATGLNARLGKAILT